MLYDIGLRILYSYVRPAAGGRHLLRMMPAELPGEQRLIAGHLDIEPRPEERWSGTDFFGNQTVEIAYRTAHQKIALSVQARVDRLAETASLDVSPRLTALAEELASARQLGSRAPLHFAGPSTRVRLAADVVAYAEAMTEPAMTAIEAVETLGKALHRDLHFDPDATTVDTPLEEAFAERHGVCQDFSHVMIAGLRGLGIPAGYVSGFLRTDPPPGRARLEGADAMHAWVMAWCGADTGWIEYDPTNAVRVGADHIVVARGRDYSDVAPVKGVLKGSGGQASSQAVDVVPLAR